MPNFFSYRSNTHYVIQKGPWSHPLNPPRSTSPFVTGSTTMVGLEVSARVSTKFAGISVPEETKKKKKQKLKNNHSTF